MEYSLDLGAWNAVFAVPCALVDRHIKLAGKEQLQTILWILRHAGERFTPEALAGELGMSRDDALDALDYWQDRGVLAVSDCDLLPVPQQEDAPVKAAAPEEPARQEAAADPEPEKPGLPPKKRMVKPDAAYLSERVKGSAEIRTLLQEAQSVFGTVLSPAMTSVLLASRDDYGLPVEVILMLLHYAKEVGKTGTAYIDSVARDWAESGIFTLEAAEIKLQELSEKQLAWGKVSAAAGLSKRSPSKKEAEAAYRWVYEWKFSPEMLSAAYDRCVDNTGKFSAAYMDRVLDSWQKAGIRSVKDIEKEEQRKKNDKNTPSSFNIDELEDRSFFNLSKEL